MANRITQKNVEAVCQRINVLTGSPSESYIDRKVQIGNYHISGAYGGVSLHRMVNESGGVSDVFGSGHMPKADLYYRMHAFIRGIESANGGGV